MLIPYLFFYLNNEFYLRRIAALTAAIDPTLTTGNLATIVSLDWPLLIIRRIACCAGRPIDDQLFHFPSGHRRGDHGFPGTSASDLVVDCESPEARALEDGPNLRVQSHRRILARQNTHVMGSSP